VFIIAVHRESLLSPAIKTYRMFQMSDYKRNQIEEAISRIVEPQSPRPTSGLRTRLKRLLDTDRALGRAPRSVDPERANYAFYSAKAPGSGVEVWFSEYEGFALLIGLLLMAHGWPQGFAVSVMRRVRAELEKQHARVLKQDANLLFDQEAIRRSAKPGDFAFDNTDPVLLAIVTKSAGSPNEEGEPLACAVFRGAKEAMKFLGEKRAGPGTMLELVGLAHRFSKELARTEPRRRGRSG
jgi:hypothetical protein